MIGTVIIVFLVLLAIFGPLLSPYDPYQLDTSKGLTGPSSDHLLGTDNYGRDLATRILYGAKAEVFIECSVAATTTMIETALGMLASDHRCLDNVVMGI